MWLSEDPCLLPPPGWSPGEETGRSGSGSLWYLIGEEVCVLSPLQGSLQQRWGLLQWFSSKEPPCNTGDWVRSLGWEHPLEKWQPIPVFLLE